MIRKWKVKLGLALEASGPVQKKVLLCHGIRIVKFPKTGTVIHIRNQFTKGTPGSPARTQRE